MIRDLRDHGVDLYVAAGNEIVALQVKANVTQAQMATAMGIPLRTYEDIVAGRSKLRAIHIQAAEYALLEMARERGDISILTPALADLVLDLAKILKPDSVAEQKQSLQASLEQKKRDRKEAAEHIRRHFDVEIPERPRDYSVLAKIVHGRKNKKPAN